METILLRIDSNLRTEGSYSKALDDFFVQQLEKQRDLSQNEINQLNQKL